MQRPTCTNVRIRSTQDAHKIFFAIQRGVLHMVTRRLDAEERQALTTGCVYAWEERGPHTEITGLGIERFTEGRRWSPSRVRDEFLFYYEKYSPVADVNNPGASPEKQPPRDWDPLVKQTYSVWVETEKGRRKWHLTAYFTQTTVDDLGTIDDILGVQELVPPPGLFKSTRVGKGRGKQDEPSAQSDSSSKPPTTVTRTYAPFSTLPNRYPSQSESPPASESVMMYEPYENIAYTGYANSEARIPRYTSPHSPPPPPPPLSHHHQSVSPVSHSQYNVASTTPNCAPQPPTLHSSLTSSAQVQGWKSPATPGVSTQSASYGPPPHHQPPLVYSTVQHAPRSRSPTYPTTTPIQPINTDGPPRLYSPKHLPPPHLSGVQAPTSSHSYSDPTQYMLPEHQETLPPLHTTLSSYVELSPSSTVPIYSPQHLVRPISEHTVPSYELLPGDPRTSEGRRGSIGPDRDLAPIYALTRAHPYRRDPLDDKTLRLLTPRSS